MVLCGSDRVVDAMQDASAGSIRGVVYDKDYDVPLGSAEILIVETGQRVSTSEQGNFVFRDVAPGRYTLVFSKDGYSRQVKADVAVAEGALTDVDASLPGEFTEFDEFLVQDTLNLGAGTEIALLDLRVESAALLDSIGAELMSRAGAGDAAAALRLVAGASVQDGKSAVIRGLPDRYVSSQMNGVRLPSADEDKRAVELDQFPSAVIESIQVSKTFTPDQQGDASGGAVNIRLKGIPEQSLVRVTAQSSRNSQVRGRHDFLTYAGGGVDDWGKDGGARDQQLDRIGANWDGATGTSEGEAPPEYKLTGALGGRHAFDNGLEIGAFADVFYDRDASYSDHGIDDSFWVETPGARPTPETGQGTPTQGDFQTSLFDVTKSSDSVQWGELATLGAKFGGQALNLTYLRTHDAEDSATLATDTRGKEHFFPGYDPNNPTSTGNEPTNRNAAPYVRTETIEYTERSSETLQLSGKNELPWSDLHLGDAFVFTAPQIDWVLADSSATQLQPDKRQFGAIWLPPSFNPGAPPFLPPFTTPPTWLPYKPSANFTLGNFQRTWKEIGEDSREYALDLKLPFKQWSDSEGYLKAGRFRDKVRRSFDQDNFSNFNDNSSFTGDFDQPWSGVFPSEDHPITASVFDVDYRGEQKVSAWYGMADLPLTSSLDLIGGARGESTHIGIVNQPESGATWYPPGASAPVALHPGDADVSFRQDDLLPSLGLIWKPVELVTLRGSYSETIARQTFKELTPILQQEFLGGPIFIGNPELRMSSLKNYDLRADYVPYEGALVSTSWFRKDIEDPIEYVQRVTTFTFTTPVNYPKGALSGEEFELRQDLGHWWESFTGVAIGANATFIHARVDLPDDEIAAFRAPGVLKPISTRDMTGAPRHLYNLYTTYDIAPTGTQLSAFYTVQGDTLVAGAGESNGNFVPNIYAKEFATLNVGVTQPLGEHLKLQFQVKNLTNPSIKQVYRAPGIGGDVRRSSYAKGLEYSLALSAEFKF